ncbi:MAG: carbohydrate-binding family 9-like protein [Eudoraea sp.]|nr:carbohydrate-binding family 9-like protein [Eudoraea sp.]
MLKRTYLVQLILMLGCLLILGCVGNNSNEYQIEAAHISKPPVIDGIANEAAWQLTKPIYLKDNRTGNTVNDPKLMTQVMVCYNDDTLYLAFICYDPDIWTTFTQRDEHLWEEEAVEVFIDVDDVPETYVEVEVSPANVLFDSYIVDPKNIDVPATALLNLKGIRTAVKVNGTLNKHDDIDESWTVEIALPFKDLTNELTRQISDETDIRINFYRLDMNEGMERGAFAWSPTGASFHKPSVFGRLVLK